METTEYVYKDILDDTTNILFNKLLVNISEEETSVKGFTGNDLSWEWRKRHLGKHQLWLMVTFDCNRFRTNFFFFILMTELILFATFSLVLLVSVE